MFFLAIFAAFMAKPTHSGDSSNANLENMVDSVENLRWKYEDPRINEEMKYILKMLDREGVLDIQL